MMANFEITKQENVRGCILTLALVVVIECYVTSRGVCLHNYCEAGRTKERKEI